MAFLLFNDYENILINKVGESIYLKTYPGKYSQKTNVIGKSIYNEYSASIDYNKKMHLVYKTSQNSIVHLAGKDSNFATSILLDDTDNSYQISNIKLLSGEKTYLFYSALNPYENTNDLIFHNFQSGDSISPQSLLDLPSLHSKYQCSIDDHSIYLCSCIVNNKLFELNLYTYNIVENTWENYVNLVTSEYPITDFCYVLDEDTIHIVYVVEKFGHSTLNYIKQKDGQSFSVEIVALGQKIKPIIFIYNEVIWINYLTSQILYSSFSNNGGEAFSSPIKCTLQNTSIKDIYLYGYQHKNLHGNHYLGYIDHQPNVAVLSQIDVDKILFYSTSNTELREMMKGSLSSSQPTINQNKVEELERELNNLKELQKNITQQYNDLANFTRDVQVEGKRWRKKYQKLSREMKNSNEPREVQISKIQAPVEQTQIEEKEDKDGDL